ncbi:(d)CMP kinase [Candidatus Pseudomonas adelgestsugas]|uniref:Cytidylate kinase n=1 Tax=Candidatus Pseudomonas adelgestsugas TaxID=1302376 RepID=A0ABX5R8N6_9PSED|nr:(d)CMP kinase [Candidatus Pseudomonas adelgestsugas]QAX82016.1 Cytidylate kinase [Candidatus Pseudomonas adelgestsugas]
MNIKVPVITIDGPSGSGKGTIAGLLARRLGWCLLDSGALYRLLALAARNHGVDLANEKCMKLLAAHLDVRFVGAMEDRPQRIILESKDVTDDLRNNQIDSWSSCIAELPAVRNVLLQRQRAFQEPPGLVADGRDMGTVVFPGAPLKIFLTASVEERARRRYLQLKGKVDDVILCRVLNEIRARDERDIRRVIAPLKPAADAIYLNSTALSVEQVLKLIVSEIAIRDIVG